jgi:poly [ADP-ribose] polymerase
MSDPKPGKYAYLERSYEDSSDEDEAEDKNTANGDEKTSQRAATPQSTLDVATQDLMKLIFNQDYFDSAMKEMNYDANKLPLGKLSKTTINRGYQALKDLSEVLDDPTLAASRYNMNIGAASEHLSNLYYSLIPHAFGRNRPPVINTNAMLKREIELLESLADMKDAAQILKVKKEEDDIHPLDRQFQGLGLEEMTPLTETSSEFTELKNYLCQSVGATHGINYQVENIFRIERQGEIQRFENQFGDVPQDRRLLWHGSRCTNFAGILSQGLRIAPPEAPVSGYMFGKGIYLADMSSKSAGYCASYASNGHALLLLCEAELGKPIQTLTNADFEAGENAKKKGMLSTWGQGSTGPQAWKDAECVHPSLKGVTMVSTHCPVHCTVLLALLTNNWTSSPTWRFQPDRRMCLAPICSIMSTSCMMSLRFDFDIF